MKHNDKLEKVIKSLPTGSTALVENFNDKNKKVCLVIKDRFNNFSEELLLQCKGAEIKKGNVVLGYIMFRVFDRYKNRYYPFVLNYCNENSLKFILELSRQKRLYIIFCDEDGVYIENTLSNNLRRFMKKYIKNSIKQGYIWTDEEISECIKMMMESYERYEEIWNNIGEKIDLS